MTDEDRAKAEEIILRMRDACVEGVRELSQLGPLDDKGKPLGLHKQWANRYIEPWMWHTIVPIAPRRSANDGELGLTVNQLLLSLGGSNPSSGTMSV
jgi:hypothetical protein